jgi:hypothetical protein
MARCPRAVPTAARLWWRFGALTGSGSLHGCGNRVTAENGLTFQDVGEGSATFVLRRWPGASCAAAVLMLVLGSPVVQQSTLVLLLSLIAPLAWPWSSGQAGLAASAGDGPGVRPFFRPDNPDHRPIAARVGVGRMAVSAPFVRALARWGSQRWSGLIPVPKPRCTTSSSSGAQAMWVCL